VTRRPHNREGSLDISLGSTHIAVDLAEHTQGRSLEVILDHPAARVDLGAQGFSDAPDLSETPHSDGIDWVLNNAFKNYQKGFDPERWFDIRKPLRSQYAYGEPCSAPEKGNPHSMVPGDALVDENGSPLRVFWDTPREDLIRQVEKNLPEPGGGLGLPAKWSKKRRRKS